MDTEYSSSDDDGEDEVTPGYDQKYRPRSWKNLPTTESPQVDQNESDNTADQDKEEGEYYAQDYQPEDWGVDGN